MTGFLLLSLMFTPEEIEAIVLGSRWVGDRADDRLRDAARSALERIAAVSPAELRDDLDISALLVGPGTKISAETVDLPLLRRVIRICDAIPQQVKTTARFRPLPRDVPRQS